MVADSASSELQKNKNKRKREMNKAQETKELIGRAK